MSIGMSFLVTIYIVLFSHLKTDKDFSHNTKIGSYIVFGILGLAYLYFRVFA